MQSSVVIGGQKCLKADTVCVKYCLLSRTSFHGISITNREATFYFPYVCLMKLFNCSSSMSGSNDVS